MYNGSFSYKCIVLSPASLRVYFEKCMVISLFSVLFAMTYIHVNKITHKKLGKWFILTYYTNFSFSVPIKTACPDDTTKNNIILSNSTWMHLNMSTYAVWIQLRVFYSVNNIIYTSLQRFEKKNENKNSKSCVPRFCVISVTKIQGAIYHIMSGLHTSRFQSCVSGIGLTPVNILDYPRPHHKIVPKILK